MLNWVYSKSCKSNTKFKFNFEIYPARADDYDHKCDFQTKEIVSLLTAIMFTRRNFFLLFTPMWIAHSHSHFLTYCSDKLSWHTNLPNIFHRMQFLWHCVIRIHIQNIYILCSFFCVKRQMNETTSKIEQKCQIKGENKNKFWNFA